MENQTEKDFYKDWLNIPEDQRPPNHYQLLGIREFEDDLEVIRKATLERYAKVKVFQTSQYREDCVRILNEISRAKVVLINPKEKQAYDEKLGRQTPQLGAGAEPQHSETDPLLSFRQHAQAIARSAGGLNEEVRKQIHLSAERQGILWADVAAIIEELEMDWPNSFTSFKDGLQAGERTPSVARADDAIQQEDRSAQPPPRPSGEARAPVDQHLPAAPKQHPAKTARRLTRHRKVVIASCVAAVGVTFLVVSLLLIGPSQKDESEIVGVKTETAINVSETTDNESSDNQGTQIPELTQTTGDRTQRVTGSQQNADVSSSSTPSAQDTEPPLDESSQQTPFGRGQKGGGISPEKRRLNLERSYSAAEAVFDSGDYDAALPILQQFARQYPDSEHIPEVQEMLRKADNRKKAQKLYNTGKAALDEERYRDAVEPFEQLIEKHPQSEWAPSAKKGLDKVNKLLVERIASDAWVVREEYGQLKQTGWASDKTSKLKDIAGGLEGWSFSDSKARLSKDTIDLPLKKRREGKAQIYLSDRANQQIIEKELLLVGDEWATTEQLQERGYIRFGNDWFTPAELLKHQVVTARANFGRFFDVRDESMFGDDLRDRSPTMKRVCKFSWPKLLDFQPGVRLAAQGASRGIGQMTPKDALSAARRRAAQDRAMREAARRTAAREAAEMRGGFGTARTEQTELSDEILGQSKWIAAGATVKVGYKVEITDHYLSTYRGRKIWRALPKHERQETATYFCLLIRDCEAIRKFLNDKKKSGEFSFSRTKKTYTIPAPSTVGFGAMGRPGAQKGKQYRQSIYFHNRKYGFVIAVISEPELNYIFEDLRKHMPEESSDPTSGNKPSRSTGANNLAPE